MNNLSGSTIRSYRLIAPAKVNLHLEILGLRKDGFHELAMFMQSINLFDRITLSERIDNQIILDCGDSDLSIGDDNLIIRAANLIRKKSKCIEFGAKIELDKKIPIGAGLAGGSSDAAATLIGLNKLWGLDFSNEELKQFGAELGSDVPFCISGGSQICFGRGEQLEDIGYKKSSMAILLVKDPLVSISTPWAYKCFRELNSVNYLDNEKDFEDRRQNLRSQSWLNPLNEVNVPPLRNDLQKIVSLNTPSVRNALKLLSDLPKSLGAAMSGSGPSCFALFPDLDCAKSASEKIRFDLSSAGLQSWCCSFLSEGVKFENDY